MSENKLGHVTEEYDPLQQYVEKERTRTLLIEAARGGTITDYWRQVLIAVIFVLAIGGTFVARTKRFHDVMDKLAQDPATSRSMLGMKKLKPKAGRISDPDKLVADAEAQWLRQEQAAAAAAAAGPDLDDPAALAAAQASREALGARLEAVGSGKALPPDAAAVTAALQGNAAPGLATGGALPVPGAPVAASPATVAAAPVPGAGPARAPAAAPADVIAQAQALLVKPTAPGAAPAYITVRQIPPAYIREKQEFPDIP